MRPAAARWPKRLVASLLLGAAMTIVLATLAPLRPLLFSRSTWFTIEAADFVDRGDGEASATWLTSGGLDVLRCYRSRHTLRTGLPFVQNPERLEAWASEPLFQAWKQPLDPPWNEEELALVRAGWPFHAFEGGFVKLSDLATKAEERRSFGAWPIGRRLDAIPYRVIPGGFAMDAFAWGAAFYLWWTAWTAWRIAARRKQHRCASCGHALAPGQAGCPECGDSGGHPRPSAA